MATKESHIDTLLSNFNFEIADLDSIKVGVLVSKWNSDITTNLLNGAVEVFEKYNFIKENIIVEEVPGSFELIYSAKRFLQTNKFDVVIVIGCIIQGETKHFDFIADGITQGIKDLNIQYDTPTIFCILTDLNKKQSIDRSGGNLGNKGHEAAIAAMEMLKFRKKYAK